jgi:hypothetical protein
MRIYPFYPDKDGIKEIEMGNNPGIQFARAKDPELLDIAYRYQNRIIARSPIITIDAGAIWREAMN